MESKALLLRPHSASVASACLLKANPHAFAKQCRFVSAPVYATPIKWESKSKIGSKGLLKVKCTAEGIDRRMVVPGTSGERIWVLPERYKVAALTALVMCLCNSDRVVMSVAVVPLAAQYGWTSSFLGIVQSSFLWGYLLSTLLIGTVVDKYGGKKVLGWGVAVWSLATLLTPWAASHSTAALLAVRIVFGLAQGVAFPGMSSMLSRWFPTDEKATAVGVSMAGFHLGSVAGLLLTPLMTSSGISSPFIFFSAMGALWLSSWITQVTSDPRYSSSISSSELRLIEAGRIPASSNNARPSLRLLLSKPAVWAILLANITNNWGYFVLLSWMPTYFNQVFSVNLKQAAWFSAGPWGTMAVCGYLAGAVSDFLVKKGVSLTKVRKIMQSIGFIGPGILLLCLNYAKTPSTAAAYIAMALSFGSFSQAGFLLNMHDVAPQHVGFLHGISNCAATFAAIISTIGTGYFVQWLGSFQAFLTVTSGLYFFATIFWNLHSTGERVF